MKIVIAGGSGFVGKKLTTHFTKQGHEIFILTRSAPKKEQGITYVQWLKDDSQPENELEGADVFINLAGVSLNKGRWNEEEQENIYKSRMDATNEIVRIMQQLDKKPSTLIQASAIGIYPTSETASYTEASPETADNFLGTTVKDWEKTASQAVQLTIRVVYTRFGVILGKDEGALPPIVMPYKLFVGGKVGSGKQWLSWVHVDDVVGAIDFAIHDKSLQGPVNVTAPNPERMNAFGKTVGKTVSRPHWLPVPSFAMKLLLGKKSILVLEGQYVTPEKLLNHGFIFSYPRLDEALQNILTEEV